MCLSALISHRYRYRLQKTHMQTLGLFGPGAAYAKLDKVILSEHGKSCISLNLFRLGTRLIQHVAAPCNHCAWIVQAALLRQPGMHMQCRSLAVSTLDSCDLSGQMLLVRRSQSQKPEPHSIRILPTWSSKAFSAMAKSGQSPVSKH